MACVAEASLCPPARNQQKQTEMKKSEILSRLLSLVVLSWLMPACESIDDSRIPSIAVYIDISGAGMWEAYGVHGYGEYRTFDMRRNPGSFPYTYQSRTGFGGVLLIQGISGPLAYDMACPYEVDRDITVRIDPDNFEAYCPECGSRYNVCEGYGVPVSGPSYDRQYGMHPLHVTPSNGGYIISY